MKKCTMNVSIASDYWSYYPGQEVLLDDDLAAAWNENGHCTIIEDAPEPQVDAPAEIVAEIVKLGGGWYQVPDGNTFRGIAAAEQYMMNGGAANGGDNAPQQANSAGVGTSDISNGQATP